MNFTFVTFSLISSILAFNAPLCLCIEKGSTPSQRQSLASPRVSCSQRGIKAVFGAEVISDIRVKGEIATCVYCHTTTTRFTFKKLCSFYSYVRQVGGHVHGASVWELVWSQNGQRQQPESCFLQHV